MSLKGINWGRGLFRSWIVIAITWIICSGFRTLVAVKEHHSQIDAERKVNAIIKSFDEQEMKSLDLFFLLNQKDINYILETKEKIKHLSREDQKKFLSLQFKEFNKLAQEEQKRMVSAIYGSEATKNQIYFWLLLTFIPPAVLFVLGSAFLWVCRGFLPNPKVN